MPQTLTQLIGLALFQAGLGGLGTIVAQFGLTALGQLAISGAPSTVRLPLLTIEDYDTRA